MILVADPIDGVVTIDVDDKFTVARINVSSPKDGGRPVSEQTIKETISNNGIRFNINQQALDEVLSGRALDRTVVIASAIPPVDGVNGSIKYNYETSNAAEVKTDEFGNVDYRDLGTIKNITKGTVIAEITQPTPGKPGKDIRGVEIKQYPGKPAPVKYGSGIKLSEDGAQLIADVSGNLRWDKTHFVIDKDLTVSGDVDFSIGNIYFIGDIIIKGRVAEGFSVKADGNITIFGDVTGAVIESGNDISVRLGITSSEVKCGGNLTADFCENSTVTAKGTVTAQNFFGCTVMCEGNLCAKGGKATIVGGKYTCLSDVEANYLGSDTYTRTLITLGNVAVLVEERLELNKVLKERTNQLSQLELVCQTLQAQKKAAGSLAPEREEMLSKSIKAKYAHVRAINETKKRLEDIEEEIVCSNDLSVKVKRNVFPGVTIRINNSQLVIAQKYPGCTIKMDENREITVSYGA